MTQFGDTLVALIATSGDDSQANELLKEFFSGYPIERLRRLLRSENEGAVTTGAWIASELGERVMPLVDDLKILLTHPAKRVRFFALDGILAAGTPEHGEAIAAAVELIDDAEEAVRWKAMNFLARASSDQLAASLPYRHARPTASLTAWLLDCDRTGNTKAILARIEDNDRRSRLFAGATAARVADRDLSPLKRAAEAADPEVSSFALEQLRSIREREQSWS